MKTVTVKKMTRVEAPAGAYVDIVAFQLVEFTINFFGRVETFILDTKILNDGRQVVHGGNGFVADGYEIA